MLNISLIISLQEKGVLNISDISRGDAGIYTLKAKNSEGETVMNFELNVQCECHTVNILYPLSTGRLREN